MKAGYKITAALAVTGFAVTAAIAARPMPRKVAPDAIDASAAGSVAGPGTPFNYTTGFEQADGFTTTGYISNTTGVFPAGCNSTLQNPGCWGHTAAGNASLITPTIEVGTNPFAGTQHVRVTPDPSTRTNIANFGLGVDVRFPHTATVSNPSVRPIAPNTVSVMMAISSPFGQDFRVQPQSNNQGFLATSALFFYSGAIYILDDLCGATGLAFIGTGAFWDTTGGYQNYTVGMNPCGGDGAITYSYAGAQIYAGCVIAGTTLEQFLTFGDNYPGSSIDLDDLRMSSEANCPSECGNGIFEPPVEQCEPGVQECNPGHACTDCQCSRTCTLNEPCELTNGANGPFYGPFDASFGGIFIYTAPAGVDAVSVELCGSTGADQRIFYWGSCTDPNDPGSANDDCYPGYSGADPSASCYGTVTAPNYESCTCHDNPLPGDNCYLLQIRPPAGAGEIHIEVNKKAVCGQGHLGSCCDTNGADTGCTDNVLAADCAGADDRWTENGKCADIVCECIPDCAGATCGDDGCGGSCGTCDDGNVCNGLETCNANRTCDAGTPLTCNDGNACNGVETCDPIAGCRPGQPLNCDNGLACDGLETCNPSSGCVGGTPVNCDDGRDCSIDTCNEPDGSCSYDESDCSIPTVSEWGLVVLTLMLLIGAKVYFGRRQAIA